MVKSILHPNIIEVTVAFPAVVNGIARNALPEHREIEVFIICSEADAILNRRIPAANPCPVIIIVNLSVGFAIRSGNIFIPDPAQSLSRLGSRIGNLILAFKNTVRNKSIIGMKRMPLNIIPFQCTSSVGILYGLGQVSNRIFIMTYITANTVGKIFGRVTPVPDFQFNSVVCHIRSIHPLVSAFSDGSEIGWLKQHAISILVIIIDGTGNPLIK